MLKIGICNNCKHFKNVNNLCWCIIHNKQAGKNDQVICAYYEEKNKM